LDLGCCTHASISFTRDPTIPLPGDLPRLWVLIGSCNGLLLFTKPQSTSTICYPDGVKIRKTYFRISNPATRKVSEIPESFRQHFKNESSAFRFTFGYDDSTDTHKVVAFRPGGLEVKVFNLGDNIWRDIQSLPVIPYFEINDAVYFSGSIHWLALYNYSHSCYEWAGITIDQFVIISLTISCSYLRVLMK
jgi:F-box interacting protein